LFPIEGIQVSPDGHGHASQGGQDNADELPPVQPLAQAGRRQQHGEGRGCSRQKRSHPGIGGNLPTDLQELLEGNPNGAYQRQAG